MKTTKNFLFTKAGIIGPILGFAVATAVIGFSYFYHVKITDYKQLEASANGLRTCFTRVGQAFTAHLLAQGGGNYLSSSFMANTADCVADVINLNASSALALSSDLGKKLNEFSNDLHWFHARLERSTPGTDKEVINNKFSKLEQLSNSILDGYTSLSDQAFSAIQQMRIYGVTAASLCLVLFSGFFFRDRRRRNILAKLEMEAQQELASSDFLDDQVARTRVVNIIQNGMQTMGMSQCATLFSRYHAESVEERSIQAFVKNDLSAPIVTSSLIATAELSSTDGELEQKLDSLEKINFTFLINDVVDMLSDKMFVHGIMLDHDIDDNIFISANKDALEQVIYNLLSRSIEALIENKGERRINIRTKPLGGTLLFKIMDTGAAMDADSVRFINGENNGANVDVRLMLSKEFMKDFAGQMISKYRRNEVGSINGNIVELVFHRAEADQTIAIPQEIQEEIIETNIAQESHGHLVSLMKGSKKDILERIGREIQA